MTKIKLRREKAVKLKNARGRRKSSNEWLRRQLNDPYVALARAEGLRSRAAFKIIEIDEKFKIFKKDKIVIDLGAAPGGWSQYAVSKVGDGNVIALDILEINEIEGVHFLCQDFLDIDAKENIMALLREKCDEAEKCDVILSDMAPNTCGDRKTDHLRIIDLLEDSLDLAMSILAKNGVFVAKIFKGGAQGELLLKLKKNFKLIKHFKPESSRKSSAEEYLVATGFKDE